jgi:hemoglobin
MHAGGAGPGKRVPDVRAPPLGRRRLSFVANAFGETHLWVARAVAGVSPTLYQELGGEPAVEAVVDEFYDRVLADESLAPFFEDVSMDRLRAHQVAFISAVTGGPDEYDGADMRAAHARLDIEDRDFDAVAGHLADALRDCGAEEEQVETVLAEVEPLREPVVEG